MKKHLTFISITMVALMVTITTNSALGQGNNFKIDGNPNLNNTTFLGSTNLASLIFKTNNIERGSFSATGSFKLNSLTGTNTGLVQTDGSGLLTRFNFSGNANEVLYGNGVWGTIPQQSHWTQIGNDIFYNHGNVGIGTNTPSSLYKLDVIGDVRVSNNLYVGGGIVITEKVQANVKVNTASLEADSIIMDSTKAFYGLSTFAGDVRLQNKLDVTGNAIVSGDFKTTGFTKLSGNVQIDSLGGLGYKPDSLSSKSYKMLFADESGNVVSKMPGCQTSGTISWMLGGNWLSNANNNYIGTCNIYPMPIWTNGQERMRITQTGAVGIGTASPIATLDVEGTFRVSSLTSMGTSMVIADANGNIGVQSIPTQTFQTLSINGHNLTISGGNTITLPNDADNLGNHSATQNIKLNDYYLSNNGTGGIRISNSGRVGINTIPSTVDDFKVSGTSFFASPVGFGVAPDPYLILKASGNCVLSGYTGIGGAQDGTLTYKLKVYGSALTSGGSWIDSDKRFKKDIKKLDNSLDKIMKLSGVQYTFNKEKFSEKGFNDGNNFGFIAQDVKEILPEVVKQDGDGYYAINYDAITPVLVEAIKAQQAIIEKQTKQIEDLQNSVTQLNNISNFSSSSLLLSEKNNEDGIILFQNKPNPFSETTIIQYKLPMTINNASLIVYDLQGKQLKKYENLLKGENSITINGGELYAGMFIYILVVNGNEISSKRMILTK